MAKSHDVRQTLSSRPGYWSCYVWCERDGCPAFAETCMPEDSYLSEKLKQCALENLKSLMSYTQCPGKEDV